MSALLFAGSAPLVGHESETPKALLNTLTKDETQDLMAYLLSGDLEPLMNADQG